MSSLYAYAPEPDEPYAGMVAVADNHGVVQYVTPEAARALAKALYKLADTAEGRHDEGHRAGEVV